MSFLYFGYGSNMDATSLAAKGVVPAWSRPASLRGWRLRFNVAHFFPHEGGVGNIVPAAADADAMVWGVLHECADDALAALDRAELYPHGYDRVTVRVQPQGQAAQREALAYVGTPGFIDDARKPTRRYLNILVKGARGMGLDEAYMRELEAQAVHVNPPPVPYVAPQPAPGSRWPEVSATELAAMPRHTALDGHLFDMSEARWQHRLLWPWFGARDMTLFHLQRMDSADGSEGPELVSSRRYTSAQRRYLDEYLQAYAAEYRYAGRYVG